MSRARPKREVSKAFLDREIPSQGRVLIVSDEPNIRRALRITLVARGYEVADTQSAEAVAKVQCDGTPDLVLVDSNTRENSGIETCRKIRNVSDATVIIMSGANAREAQTQAAQAEAHDYICKPFSLSQITASLHTHSQLVKAGR